MGIYFTSLSFSCLGQIVEGYVTAEDYRVTVEVINNGNTIAGTLTDDNGMFSLAIPKGSYILRVIDYPCDTVDIQFSIGPFEKKHYTFKFPRAEKCRYAIDPYDDICPTCGKTDKVIPIYYGLQIVLPPNQIRHGHIKGDGKKFIIAGCMRTCCDPHWYCKRDKTKF